MPLFVTDPIYIEHFNGPDHLEQPARMQSIETRLKNFCLWDLLDHIPAADAALGQIERCHGSDYVARVREASEAAADSDDGIVHLATITKLRLLDLRGCVLVGDDVIVRKGDGEGYDRQFKQPLHEGVEFVVLEIRGGWIHIKLPDENRGWIQRRNAVLF